MEFLKNSIKKSLLLLCLLTNTALVSMNKEASLIQFATTKSPAEKFNFLFDLYKKIQAMEKNQQTLTRDYLPCFNNFILHIQTPVNLAETPVDITKKYTQNLASLANSGLLLKEWIKYYLISLITDEVSEFYKKQALNFFMLANQIKLALINNNNHTIFIDVKVALSLIQNIPQMNQYLLFIYQEEHPLVLLDTIFSNALKNNLPQ